MPNEDFSASDLLGSVVDGRFEILEKLGEGGMGAIYKARQISMDRIVALKILLHDQRGDPISVERFRHEAYLASRLRHPNAIVIHDFGQSADGLLYIAMEFLAGETLKDRMARIGPMPIQGAVKILGQMLRTITEAHRMGLIHRDLKPDNIFLTTLEGDTDYVKVLDFGIAKLTAVQDGVVDGYKGGLTMKGKIYGTPNYMSPEQIRGKLVDQQSDLYSLGVLFYEMLAGCLPFIAETPVEVMMMHLRDTPKPICGYRKETPVELERTVLRALEKDRRVRYRSGDEFLEALESYKFNSGFYAVPARLAAMASQTSPRLNRELSEEELGETMVLMEGVAPPIVTPGEPILLTQAASHEAAQETGFEVAEVTMMGLNVVPVPQDEPTMMEFDDAEERTFFEEDQDESVMSLDSVDMSIFDESAPIDQGVSGLGLNQTPLERPGVRLPAPDEPTMIEFDDNEVELEPSKLVPIPPTEPLKPQKTLLGLAGRHASQPEMAEMHVSKPPIVSPLPARSVPPEPRAPVYSTPPAAVAPQPAGRVDIPLVTKPAVPQNRTTAPPLHPPKVKKTKTGLWIGIGVVVALVTAAGLFALNPFVTKKEGVVSVGPTTITVASEPTGVEIFDDGRFVGETPIDYPASGKGQNRVLQFARGNLTFKTSAPTFESSSWLFIKLPKAAKAELGYATVRSSPLGATVKMGEVLLGKTPLLLVAEGNTPLPLRVELGDKGKDVEVAPTTGGIEADVVLE